MHHPAHRIATHCRTRNTVLWLFMLAMAVVQFNGHLHRIHHSGLNPSGEHGAEAVVSPKPIGLAIELTTQRQDNSASTHFHHCALLDAVSLSLGLVGEASPMPVVLTASSERSRIHRAHPAQGHPVGPPPARAPPVLS